MTIPKNEPLTLKWQSLHVLGDTLLINRHLVSPHCLCHTYIFDDEASVFRLKCELILAI